MDSVGSWTDPAHHSGPAGHSSDQINVNLGLEFILFFELRPLETALQFLSFGRTCMRLFSYKKAS